MVYSRYYYTQLTEKEKQLYGEVENACILQKNRVDITKWDRASLKRVMHAVCYDNPELFYVNFHKYKISGSVLRQYMTIDYYYTAEEIKRLQEEIENIAAPIVQAAKKLDKKDAPLYVHDRLAQMCCYKESKFKAYTIEGAFCDKECVCAGLAKAYKYIMDRLKIRCTIACGDAVHPNGTRGGHAWNIVKIDDCYCHVDVTFDLANDKPTCSRAYYGLTTAEVLYDREEDADFKMPECNEHRGVLETVSGTVELIKFLKNEAKLGTAASEVRLTKGFSPDEIIKMLKNRVTILDAGWFNKIKSISGCEKSKSIYVSWK